MSTHPLELSAIILDAGESDQRTNRITNELSDINHGISIIESFSHVLTFKTDDGLVCFDTSGAGTGTACVEALRGWSDDPVHSIVYTHGHVDHTGGSGAFGADAEANGNAAPQVVGHERLSDRLRRYDDTNGFNMGINARQFGGISAGSGLGIGGEARFLPADALWPTVEYHDDLELAVGGLSFELHHDRGETDDHTWAWVPEHRALVVGDFVTWVFPNCGNPQKVQRYPLEWARALRKMQAMDADLLLGAHGLPVQGTERVNRVLDDLATALETLVHETVEMMNNNEPLDTIIHSVSLPDDVLSRPWMNPVYDEPEFVVRNIWRLYGGWWDQNPANLKPAPLSQIGAEIAALAGGTAPLLSRATELSQQGDHRMACNLVELAVQAEPDSVEAHGTRKEIYQARRDAESSLMSKGIFAAAANESRAIADPE